MNQFLSNKIIASIVAIALLVGVGVLVSSGDTSSTTRNAALVVATPCTKPGQVTKVSKQSVVCATTNTGSLWYATMKAKGKAQPCTTPGEIRQKPDIVWVCGVVKKKKLWQATQPLSALAAKGVLPNANNADLADPAALSLLTKPSGGVNAVALKTQPVVQLLDQGGAPISRAGITIEAVPESTNVVLSGNTAVTDATGRATFTTLSLKGIMGTFTLIFTAPLLGLQGVISRNHVLAAGVATALVSDTKLVTVAAGQLFNQSYKLHLEDSSGNVVAGAGRDVIVSSSPEGLSGATTVPTAKDGYVLFKDLMLTQAGTTTLTFTSGDLSTASTVVVKPGDSQGLKITTEASEAATNNRVFPESPVVQLFDAEGNKVATAGITVTATITQFPTGATAKTSTLVNSTATTNGQGIATFTGLGIKGLTGAYTLGYTPDKGVTQQSRKTITLSAGVVDQLTLRTAAGGPVGNSTAGKWSLIQSPVIVLLDISNNPVPTKDVRVTATVIGQDPTTAQTNDKGEAEIPIIFSVDSANDHTITYNALTVRPLLTSITLPYLRPEVSRDLTVPEDKDTSSDSFQLTPPTSNSDGGWSHTSSEPTVATVTITGLVTDSDRAGTTTITATQEAKGKYGPVTSTAILEIARSSQKLVSKLTYPPSQTTSSGQISPYPLPTSTNTTGDWSYTSSNTAVATVNTTTGLVTVTGRAGRTTITATQEATDMFESITMDADLEIALTLAVTQAWTVSDDRDTPSDNFQLTPPTSTNTTGGWSYTSSNTAVATVTSTGLVTVTDRAGRTTITATQEATEKFTGKMVEADLVIYLAMPMIDEWVLPTNKTTLSAAFQLTPPTSTSDGGWSYTSSNTAVATVNTTTGLVTVVRDQAGRTTITATQEATEKYAPVTSTADLEIKYYGLGTTGPGGGNVFYRATTPFACGWQYDPNLKCNYLEAAQTNATNFLTGKFYADWGCSGTNQGATATAIGTGRANTTNLRSCDGSNVFGANPAARVAADYRSKDYADWFLPSRDELREMYLQKTYIGISFVSTSNGEIIDQAPYWSSTVQVGGSFWEVMVKYLSTGREYNAWIRPALVRPIRAF